MKQLLKRLADSTKHLEALHKIFVNKNNYDKADLDTFDIYIENDRNLSGVLRDLQLYEELYSIDSRQMILSDLYEYIFFARGFYGLNSTDEKEKFVKAILTFVNLLMCYESITVSSKLRKRVLIELGKAIPIVEKEEYFTELKRFKENIGLPKGETQAPIYLQRYFDKMLPKTAGGLWHELLVFIFILRSGYGYIVPLLLAQRLLGKENNLVPPDFLLITYDKHVYGIEVGIKKEIQSGSFSLKTAIPTATVDTINSRNSDRCPACKRWIQFCPFVIKKYSDFSYNLKKIKVKCLDECDEFSRKEILSGKCKYTKYSRNKAKTLKHTHHDYADGLHYHYRCVLANVQNTMKVQIMKAEDNVAIKTHFPYYAGLEDLETPGK